MGEEFLRKTLPEIREVCASLKAEWETKGSVSPSLLKKLDALEQSFVDELGETPSDLNRTRRSNWASLLSTLAQRLHGRYKLKDPRGDFKLIEKKLKDSKLFLEKAFQTTTPAALTKM
jgi:hypothetical protein